MRTNQSAVFVKCLAAMWALAGCWSADALASSSGRTREVVVSASALQAPPIDDRSAFLSPFLPASKPGLAMPGAIQVDFLPELVGMVPSRGTFDLVQFPLPDGSMIDLWLTEFRVTDDATTLVVMQPDANGAVAENHAFEPTVRMFRGHVTGVDNSLVYLAVGPDLVAGYLKINNKIYSVSNGARGEMPVIISDIDSLPAGAINWYQYSCEVRDGGQPPAGADGGDGGLAALGTCKVVELAIETDNEFRGLFSSDQAAVNYATTIVGGMNTIYLAEVNLYPLMRFLRVWSPGTSDPWSANGSGAQLDQFVAAWGGGGGPTGSTPRDLAHLFSARNLGGGVAYLNAVCNQNIGFAVSGNLSGFFPNPLQNNSSQNWDIVVTTHEMGHNCGCNHTHDLGVDNCVGGACISNGTIMSYCHLCPGGLANIVLVFAQANKNQMDGFLPGLGCLSEPCPIYDPASFAASDGAFIDVVRLTWIPPAVAPLRYEIERREVGAGAFAPLSTNVGANLSVFDDSSAAAGINYEYRIRSVRVDTGAPSDWVGPDQGYKSVLGPTAMTASDGQFADKVKLQWTAPIGYTPTGYVIYRGLPFGDMKKLEEIGASSPTYDDSGAYINFDLTWDDTDNDGLPGPPPPTTPGLTYIYEVRAKVTATFLSAPATDSGFRATPGPVNLVASGGLNSNTPPFTNRIGLTWSLPGVVNSVFVYRSASGGPFVEVARLTGSITRWSDVNIQSNVPYSYYVRSFSNLLGMSAPSDIDLGFALMPPTITSASAGTADSVTVTWTKPPTWAPSAYTLWRKRNSSSTDPWIPIAENLGSGTLSFVDQLVSVSNPSGVKNGAVYAYAVSAKSGDFNSFSDRGTSVVGYPIVRPPLGVTATDGQGNITVSWTVPATSEVNPAPPAASVVSWQVYRRRANSGAAFTLVRTVTQPTFLDTTAAIGTIYEYHVRTRASNGVLSVPSNSDNGSR